MKLDDVREEIESRDDERNEILKQSRDILRESKKAIYLVHEHELEKAEAILGEQQKRIKALVDNPGLWVHIAGTYAQALEEYVEGMLFLAFAKQEEFPSKDDLNVPAEQYLGGVCDLTGELGRRCVHAATRRDLKEVERIHETITQIHGELLHFHLRNGPLRHKYDAVKYAVKKVEETRYDLSMRD